MNFYFIENYMSKLKKNDIENFALKENIILDDEELNNIYNYVKSNYKNIIYNDPEKTLNNIKKAFNNKTYLKVEKIYLKYKDRINNFIKYKR